MFARNKLVLLLAAAMTVFGSPPAALALGCYTMDQWATRTSTTKIDCVSGPAGQTLPPELSNLQQLEHLDVCSSNLVGTLPDTFQSLPKLTHVALCDNALTGIPMYAFQDLPDLHYLDLSKNLFNGSLPAYSSMYPAKLATMRLDNNQLFGVLPRGLAQMTLLERLAVENNRLTGTIPSAIFSFASLTSFTFAGNRVQGVTPLAADWDKFNSDVPANTTVSPFVADGGECSSNDECANFRCASLTKKCCKRTWDGEVCESSVCRGTTGYRFTFAHGECGSAWYTDYFGVDGVDNIQVTNTNYASDKTIPDEVFAMTNLTALTMSGRGSVNGLSALTNLRYLTINGPYQMSGEVNPLSQSLASLTNLERLEYGHSTVVQTLDVSLAEAWTNLKHFSMNNAEMAPFVAKLSSLTSLHLYRPRDTTWPADVVSPSLESFKLESDINMTSIADDAFVGNTALKSLTLTWSKLYSLPTSMWTLGSLTELSLTTTPNLHST
jgi:hypothetical protein